MAKSKSLKILILLLLALSCAKQVPPSGGPKDTEPPTIVATYPLNGATNFSDDKISFDFSEYIDKSSARNAVFISPSVEKFKLDWSGKTLEIIFLDSLRKETTYTVTLGTDIRDLNNKNRMAESFVLVFSTGDKIDKGKISGRVFDRNPQGVMVFAYKLSDTACVNPSETKPDYVTQCGKDGFYLFSGLAEARYALFAVRDGNSDNLYEENEQIGFTFCDVVLPNDSAALSGIDFMLTQIDTSRPALDEITMTDRNHILLEYSETIDSAKLSPENFTITDSTTAETFPIKFAYKGRVKRSKILVSFSDSLEAEHKLYLSAGAVYDMRGNASLAATSEIYFNEKPDTLAPKSLGVLSANGEKKLNFTNPALRALFDDGVNLTRDALVFISAKGDTIPVSLNKINDAEFIIKPEKKLRSNSEYVLKIDFTLFSDAAGNSIDSVFSFPFKTVDEIDLVGVEGKIENAPKQPVYVILDNLKNKTKLRTETSPQGFFKFNAVPPGKYFVWAFADENGNGKYDFGSLNPCKHSEKFTFRTDTLEVRSRWPVKNVNMKF